MGDRERILHINQPEEGMKQWYKRIWCFLVGHDWTEFTEKKMGNYIWYKDRKCGCCGELEILKNVYAYRIDFLDKDGKIFKNNI